MIYLFLNLDLENLKDSFIILMVNLYNKIKN